MATQPALPTVASFGELLHYLRRQARLTQRELAIATGYSESMISRLEHDERPPDVATIRALFAPALRLEDQPQAAERLIALALQARGELAAGGQSEPAAGRSHKLLLRRRLPARLTSFLGREAETHAVAQLLCRARLVTLTGPGGCGKTSLAVETCRWLADLAAQGASGARNGTDSSVALALDEVCMVELLPLRDPSLLPQTILAALGLQGRPQQTALHTLLNAVGDRSMLLVLDNCEHLIDAVAQIALVLLQSCANLRVLVTSRERLNLAAETLFVVHPLACPDPQRLPTAGSLADFPAVQLFVERCQAVAPAFCLLEQNATAVAQICSLLDGIPLALELGAAATTTFSVQEIAAQLDAHLLRAGSAARTADPRHTSIAGAVAWSYDLLLPAERRLLAQLAVFTGGWSAAAMQQVCGIEGDREGDCASVLHRLVQKSLVQVEPSEPRGKYTRYHLLRAVREYAAEQLAAGGEEPELRRRHFDFYAGLGVTVGRQVLGPDHDAAMTALDADHANIRAALTYGRGNVQLAEPYVQLAAALPHYWRLRGYTGESAGWLCETLQERTELPLATQALAHAAVLSEMIGSHSCFNQRLDEPGRLRQELDHAGILIETCRDQGEEPAAARLMLAVASVLAAGEDESRAAVLAREAWSIFLAHGEVNEAGLACVQLGRILLAQGKLEEAAELHRNTLGVLEHNRLPYQLCESYTVHCAIARAEGDRDGMIHDLLRIASIAEDTALPQVLHAAYLDLEGIDRKLACRLAAGYLARQQQRSPSVMLGLAAHQLGRMYLNAGRYAEAQRILDEAIQLWHTIPLQAREVLGAQWSLIDRGDVAWFQGDPELAIACFSESIRLFNASPYLIFSMYPLLSRGYVRLAEGDLDGAMEDFCSSLRVEQQAPEGWRVFYIYCLAAMGEVAHRRGDAAAAATLFAASAVLDEHWHELANSQPHELAHHHSIVQNVAQYRQDPDFEAAWQAGKMLSIHDAMAVSQRFL